MLVPQPEYIHPEHLTSTHLQLDFQTERPRESSTGGIFQEDEPIDSAVISRDRLCCCDSLLHKQGIPMTPFRMSNLILPLGIVLAAVPVWADDVVLSDQILPTDTYLHLTVANVDEARQQLADSSFGRLIQDPALDDFKAELKNAFGRQLDDGLAEFENQLGVSLIELLEIPSGEVAFSVTTVGNRIGAVLYLDFGDSESQVRSLLDLAAAKIAGVPELTQETDELDGTELILFTVDGPVPTPLIKEFGWFVRDSRLVICNSRRVMEALISNWDGQASDTFVSNPVYEQILHRCQSHERSAVSAAYFDPVGLITKLVQTGSLGQAGLGAGMAMGFFPTLGINQLKGIGGISEFGNSEFEGVGRAMLFAEQPPQGLMRAFMLGSVDPSPPDWVKEDVVLYTAINWQAAEAYLAVESLVDMVQGAGELQNMLNQLSQSGLGIHIKDDVIDQLSGSIHMIGGGSDPNMPGGEMLFALEIQDPDRFSDLLARVADEPGYPGEIREFRGATVYEIRQQDQSVAFTVVNGNFMVGIGQTLLEQVLRNDYDVPSLADSEDFRRIAQHFPSDVVSVHFSRPAEQYRSIYDMLKNGDAAQMFQGMDEIFTQINFSTLPPFDEISKYIQPSGGYTMQDENGFVSEGFTLRP